MKNFNKFFVYGFACVASLCSMPLLSLNAYAEGNVNLNDEIKFADSQVKQLCLQNWDANKDGKLSYAEAAKVTTLGQVFNNKCYQRKIVSFNELQYFTGLTSINDYAFYSCHCLEEITFPSTITSIGKQAFYNCQNLLGVSINSVKTIGESAFENCYSMKTVEMNSVQTIGKEAFKDCQNLNGFVLPACLKEIGNCAFACCNSLREFYSKATTPAVAGCCAFDCVRYCVLYVPQGSVRAYQTAKNWEPRFKAAAHPEWYDRNCHDNKVEGFNSITIADEDEIEEEVVVGNETNIVLDENKIKFIEVESDVEVNSIKYIRSFNNYVWQALYLPVSVPVKNLEENFEVAEIGTSAASSSVSFFDFEGDLQPNVAYAIRLKDGKEYGSYTIECGKVLYATKDTVMQVNGSYLLKSTYKYIDAETMAGKLALQGEKFKNVAPGTTLKPFRFYLEEVETTTNKSRRDRRAKEIDVLYGDEETAIEEIAAEPVKANFNGQVFDLNGRAVNDAKGFVIINGKKYLK